MHGDIESDGAANSAAAWRREPATLGALLTDAAYGADALDKHTSDGGDGGHGREVTLMGWVDTRRDLGALIFLWLRDRSIQELNAGIDHARAHNASSDLAKFEAAVVQVTFNPEIAPDAHRLAETLGREYVIAVKGVWRKRGERDMNARFLGGDRELIATDLRIINPAETPPFYIADDAGTSEDLRMQYRYLDLRRKPLVEAMTARHRIFLAMRNALDKLGFLEIETPMLGRSTPEGARDYLVPARNHAGKFYALPQSPQLYKQLLMVGGMDKYFQMARCFRDEDLRANRQPEFTQLDLEMSFATRDELFEVGEKMFVEVFRETLGTEVPTVEYDPKGAPGKMGFPRMTYDESMARYGVDKPDMRYGCEIADLTPVFKESEFVVFKNAIENGGAVKGIFIPDYAPSRKDIDTLTEYAKKLGAGGLAWLKFSKGFEVKGSVSNSLNKFDINKCRFLFAMGYLQDNFTALNSSVLLKTVFDIARKVFDVSVPERFIDAIGSINFEDHSHIFNSAMENDKDIDIVSELPKLLDSISHSDLEIQSELYDDIQPFENLIIAMSFLLISEADDELTKLIEELEDSLLLLVQINQQHIDDLEDIARSLCILPGKYDPSVTPSSVFSEPSIARIVLQFSKYISKIKTTYSNSDVNQLVCLNFDKIENSIDCASLDSSAFDVLYSDIIVKYLELMWLLIDISGTVLLVADSPVRKVEKVLGNLRVKLGNELKLAEKAGDANAWKFCWIVDFPLYDENPDTGALEPAHHPFTMPHPQFVVEYEPGRFRLKATTDAERLAIRADNYDLVLNGEELGSGSLRIVDPLLQRSVLSGIGMSELEIEEQFGFFLNAFRYGAPPHRGFALGMDRIVGMMLGGASIRDVIAFPKTATGSDLMTKAPSVVSARQLEELGIKTGE